MTKTTTGFLIMADSSDLFCGRCTLYMDDAITGSGGYESAYETAEKSKLPEEFD